MLVFKDILLTGSDDRPMANDLFLPETREPVPVLIYAHGYNGFKDWGNFDLIARQIADAGLAFIKFNFSHNGTTPEHPEDFVDLEAYGRDNYTKQLDDLGAVIDWICSATHPQKDRIDSSRLYLVGHSKGGGIVLLKAGEDERVKKVVTWASVSACTTPWGKWPSSTIEQWRENEVIHTVNGRTKQEMPLYFQLYENFQQNKERLDIEQAIKRLHIPILLCHGTSDESVKVENVHQLKAWQPDAEQFLPDTNHVFGRRHPWTDNDLPEPMQQVLDATISFLKK